jgi:signal transduction histidine kinase
MRSQSRVVGVLSVMGETGWQFSAEEVALLASIADHVAVAVENARLRQQAERAAVLEERERLARELHDSVTQLLYSLGLYAETGQRLATAGETQGVTDYLQRIGATAQQALKEMRVLIYGLRPPLLEQEGLAGALQARLDGVERRSGIQASLRVEGQVDLPAEAEAELYHIAQEALNNALRHGAAGTVTVYIRAGRDAIELEVVDDGVGFDTAQAGGLGLIGMAERAQRLGGALHVISALGEGTTVKVAISGKNKRSADR